MSATVGRQPCWVESHHAAGCNLQQVISEEAGPADAKNQIRLQRLQPVGLGGVTGHVLHVKERYTLPGQITKVDVVAVDSARTHSHDADYLAK